MNSIKNWVSVHTWVGPLIIFVLFLFLRIPALHLAYHQDEYKWPMYANPAIYAPGAVPHPPLTELIYRNFGQAVGYDNFRTIPFTFSIVNLFLIFYLASIVFNKKTALVVSGLFAVTFFSVLASVMVDVDGSIMPFFFLVSLIGYFKLKAYGFTMSKQSLRWLAVFGIGIIGGFLIKVAFIIPIGAFAIDFCLEKKVFRDKRKVLKSIGYGILGVCGLVGILFLAKLVFPFFRLEWAVGYWKHFAVFAGRGWFQTFIQFAKAILYLSPLLVLTPFLATQEELKRARVFVLFIGLGLFFYLFAFDFSIGALDRYFQFLVIPLCMLTGAVLARIYSEHTLASRMHTLWISMVGIFLFALQFAGHSVPPLHPKSEWISRIVSFKWNFLYPFSGGSGPTGFYISFAFMACVWFVSLVFVLWTFKRPGFKAVAATTLLILGLVYNGVFIEEYVWGNINGSPYGLLAHAKTVIAESSDIKNVLVYNDIGGHDIKATGKYERRIYAAPMFESFYKELFAGFSGHILYINIPRVGDGNLFSNYFKSCEVIYKETDRYIESKILKCNPLK